ncbi:MAG: helix-turn-helix domain-containing protein [Candidatus Rokubacteria bacterium]|nr:helix-turn-helix domain-containing protein [Candidatus Rokubacteria bacterium]
MLTVLEAARRARCRPETVRRWIRAGRLRAHRIGAQHIVDEADLMALLRNRESTLPVEWCRTVTGEPMPDVLRALRRFRRAR